MDQPLSVILHGGAGRIEPSHAQKKLPFLKQALDAAWSALCEKKPGEHAVVAALRVMEGCEYFNAGYGGYPNVHGEVLLDVGLMRGNRDFVSLMNVKKLKFPSSVALDMLLPGFTLMSTWTKKLISQVEQSPQFLKTRYGFVESEQDLVAPFIKKMIKAGKSGEVSADNQIQSDDEHGTVGCVVRDCDGNIYSGTSTGGTSRKCDGRIGDSPIIGAGVFADDEICGLSTSGDGEAFLLSVFSGFVIGEVRRALRENKNAFIEDPNLLKQILQAELDELKRKSSGNGGIIVIPKHGEPAYAFNAAQMAVAMRSGTISKIEHERVFVDDLVGEAIVLAEDSAG